MNYAWVSLDITTFLPRYSFRIKLTAFLWLGVLLSYVESEKECTEVSNLDALVTSAECEAKYLEGASYCCPDYRCCSEQEVRKVGQPCPCPADQQCCDGHRCCTALESDKIGKKCSESQASSTYCDLDNFSNLRCCFNRAEAAEEVCCTTYQFNSQGKLCYNDRSCPDHMECIDSESACYFNITFDESEVRLLIIIFIVAAIVIIIVAIIIAFCIFSRLRKHKEEEPSSVFKPAEAKPRDPTAPRRGAGVVVQIPTVSRNVPQTHYTNYGFRHSAALENPEMQLYEAEPKARTPTGSMYRESRNHSRPPSYREPSLEVSYRGNYQRNSTLPQQRDHIGAVNHGYQRSHPSMGDDHPSERPPRYQSTPPPPPRLQSIQALNRNGPPSGANSQPHSRVRSYPNWGHVPANGPRRHVVEEDDENDTLVIATDSLVINNQSTNHQLDTTDLSSSYHNKGFMSSEVNIDNPRH